MKVWDKFSVSRQYPLMAVSPPMQISPTSHYKILAKVPADQSFLAVADSKCGVLKK